MTDRIMWRAGLLALVTVIMAAGCEPERDIRTESRTVGREGARSARIELRMGAGELRLAGGTGELMEAEFRYNRSRLRPEIDYRVSGDRGVLRIDQRRATGISLRRVENEWDLRLAEDVPLDLRVRLGAGESRLDLRGLDVARLDVDMGVGELRLDLTGPRDRDLDVNVDGGIGSATILLPSDVGARVRVDGGLGSVDAHGFTKRGNVYENRARGTSDVRIEVKIDGGIGSIDLRLGDDPGGTIRF